LLEAAEASTMKALRAEAADVLRFLDRAEASEVVIEA
jgi:hypothetical protein